MRKNLEFGGGSRFCSLLGILACLLSAAPAWAATDPNNTPSATGLSLPAMQSILKEVDRRQSNNGDYKALIFLEQKEKDKNDIIYDAVVYRRDGDDKMMIMFLKPKSEAGKGYLRLDKNLFMYDPTVGKWDRRTERERIGGTTSQRADFDESRLSVEFIPSYVGEESLGKTQVHHLALRAKPGADVAYPVVHLWVDKDTHNMLKQQQMALSGRLMRTSYYPKWGKLYSESKKADVYFPQQIRIFDEVEKENRTTVVVRKVDLRPLDANIFTKAWLESKSR
jgi:hypothetical protein